MPKPSPGSEFQKMDQPRFVIEAAEAESMAQSSGLPTVTHLLPSLVSSSQSLARPPVSKFPVAALGLGSSGRIFVGVNLEFPGLPLHHTVHAEQFLLANLSINAETRLDCLAVSAAPCGHCRQFLQELRGAPDIKLLVTSDENPEFTPLSNFLSHRFGPDDLLPKGVPLLLDPRHNGLSLPHLTETETENHDDDDSPKPNGLCNCNGRGYDALNNGKLKFAALEAANNSHAPYSGSPSGVALMDCDGNIYKGSYMESAAYNPSLGPVQAALVAYIAGGGGGYDTIVAAVLVEKDGAAVKQEQTVRLLLQAISPRCQFKAFLCSSGADA